MWSLVISLHEYAIFVVTSNSTTRTILPRILGLLGQEKVSFYTKVTDLLVPLRSTHQPKLLFIDGDIHVEDVGTYRDRLYNAFIFVMLPAINDISSNESSCSANECLSLLNELEHYIFSSVEEKNAYFLKYAHTLSQAHDEVLRKEDYFYQSFSLPVESINLYKLSLPLTVRSVTQALYAILPEQTVHTASSHSVHYKLLERPKEKRIKDYRPDVI